MAQISFLTPMRGLIKSTEIPQLASLYSPWLCERAYPEVL